MNDWDRIGWLGMSFNSGLGTTSTFGANVEDFARRWNPDALRLYDNFKLTSESTVKRFLKAAYAANNTPTEEDMVEGILNSASKLVNAYKNRKRVIEAEGLDEVLGDRGAYTKMGGTASIFARNQDFNETMKQEVDRARDVRMGADEFKKTFNDTNQVANVFTLDVNDKLVVVTVAVIARAMAMTYVYRAVHSGVVSTIVGASSLYAAIYSCIVGLVIILATSSTSQFIREALFSFNFSVFHRWWVHFSPIILQFIFQIIPARTGDKSAVTYDEIRSLYSRVSMITGTCTVCFVLLVMRFL